MLIYFQYLSSIQSFFQLLHDYQRCVHLEVLLLFCLSLLNTRKNLPKFLKGLLIYFYLLDIRILFKSSVFLFHIQHFFRLVQSVYPLAYKAYIGFFYDLQLSKILPYTTAFSTPLSTSIHWGTRCWRDFHDLQLINKATTYNTFEQPLKTTILWRARLTAVFLWLATVKDLRSYPLYTIDYWETIKKSAITEKSARIETLCAFFVIISIERR